MTETTTTEPWLDSNQKPYIQIENVTKKFGGITALNNISFEVKPKSLFAIIGPNGAGKTSIFNCISGIYRPTVGSVTYGNTDIKELRPDQVAEMGIARTFQNIELFENMTVLDNILIGAHRHLNYGSISSLLFNKKARKSELEARMIAEEIIDFLEIEQFRYSYILSLPYGVQKRVEIGRALALNPEVLLLDEPTEGLQPSMIDLIIEVIVKMKAEGFAIVLVEQRVDTVLSLADRAIFIENGKSVDSATPTELALAPEKITKYLGV